MTTGSDAFRHALLSIKAEIAIAQNGLRQAATAAGRDRTGEAKELLANGKRPHESIVGLISKVPSKYQVEEIQAEMREERTLADEARRCYTIEAMGYGNR